MSGPGLIPPNITDPWPAEWTVGTPTLPLGLRALEQFMCRACAWERAADPGFAALTSLAWLDISFNQLAAGANVLPAAWDVLPLLALKARGCGLAASTSNATAGAPAALAGWAYRGEQQLLHSLRVLDLGDNPGLVVDDPAPLLGSMHLWELYLDGTGVGAASSGWPHLPCLLNVTDSAFGEWRRGGGGTQDVGQGSSRPDGSLG